MNRAQVQQVFGNIYGYTAASSDPTSALKCFNQDDPIHDMRYGLEWGDFGEDSEDLKTLKAIIADKVAKHIYLVGHSHFLNLLGGWDGYLARVDSLLAWCDTNSSRIRVKTYSEMADILYGIPQDPYLNIIPPLNVDLDNNGVPDGYLAKAGYTDGFIDATDGVAQDGNKSYAISKPGKHLLRGRSGRFRKGRKRFQSLDKRFIRRHDYSNILVRSKP